MKIYIVGNEEYYTLNDAKKAMKENGEKGYIYKVYSNGDWESCGEITKTGTNTTFLANTRQKNRNYN